MIIKRHAISLFLHRVFTVVIIVIGMGEDSGIANAGA
jgi:hypothetical protein